jgi:hypothetical protein
VSAVPVLAAAPKVDAAIKEFKAVSADAGKLKTFCAMNKTMESAGEKEDPGLDAKIDGYMKQLGPSFEAAWNASEGLDENSPDGKAWNDALDQLMEKCS